MNLRDPNSEKKREYREKQGWSDYKQWSAQQDTNGRTWVEDDNFTHDVRMYIDGDFSSDAEKLEYAESVAAVLNAAIQVWWTRSDKQAIIVFTPVFTKKSRKYYPIGCRMAYKEKQCPKCGTKHTKRGEYCSRSCGNGRVWSDAMRQVFSQKQTEFITGDSDVAEEARWRINNHDQEELPEPVQRGPLADDQFVSDGDLWTEV